MIRSRTSRAAADRFGEQLAEGRFPGYPPSIASARSAVAHVGAAATLHGIDAAPLQALGRMLDRAVEAGHGDEGYARLAQFLGSGRGA